MYEQFGKKQRIYKNRIYIFSKFKEKDTFGNWVNINKSYIASGAYYKYHLITDGLVPGHDKGNLNLRQFRLLDGHLPEQCPITNYDKAGDWVLKNPNSLAEIL